MNTRKNLLPALSGRSLLRSCAGLCAAALLLGAPLCAWADGAANAFNPYTGKPLPASRAPKGDEGRILEAIGGKPRSIATDAAWRANWREEIYPVLRGSRSARHEILVLIDFANPDSRSVWQAVDEATKGLPADQAKVVLFGRSKELYATDLVGLGIWAARERPGQAVEYISWAMQQWDAIKAGQKKSGRVRDFNNEYDAVLTRKDYPLAFRAMARFKPVVPEKDQSALAKYAYEAGNINLFQATEVATFYDVDRWPCVIVDGKVVSSVSAAKLRELVR